MGRLFDGVAAILGIKTLCSYEGQGAVLLEAAAAEDKEVYPFALEGEPLRYDWRGTIRAICADMKAGVDTGCIAARFMNTLIEMAVRQCCAAREASGIDSRALRRQLPEYVYNVAPAGKTGKRGLPCAAAQARFDE